MVLISVPLRKAHPRVVLISVPLRRSHLRVVLISVPLRKAQPRVVLISVPLRKAQPHVVLISVALPHARVKGRGAARGEKEPSGSPFIVKGKSLDSVLLGWRPEGSESIPIIGCEEERKGLDGCLIVPMDSAVCRRRQVGTRSVRRDGSPGRAIP